jgi:SNF2 family DNA or RNA helicase
VSVHGRLGYWEPPQGRRQFVLDVPPHVAIRVKRMFPRAHQARTGYVFLSATDEVARDLEWLLMRYDLEVGETARKMLAEGADAARRRDEHVAAALAGHVPPNGWREPIRPPRDYQLVADAMLHAAGSLLLLDVLGLGKTYTSLLRLRDPEALPAVVVTLTALPGQWKRELEMTLPWLVAHIVTSREPYDPAKRRGGPGRQPDVLILNYAKLAGWGAWLAGSVNTVIFDEVQELRRDGTQKYEAAARLAYEARYRIGLSATPVYNYGGEVHNVVEVIAPGFLGSRQEFVREWGAGSREVVSATGDGVLVEDPRALGTYLRSSGIMLRRTRKEVGRELPPAVPIIHNVDIDSDVLDELLEAGDVGKFAETLVAAESTSTDRFLAAGEFDMRMRQATGIAKAPYVAEFVKVLLESGEKVVVGVWHRAVYAILLEALEKYGPVMYSGSESPRQKDRSFARFVNDRTCRVMLMSLRSGAGLDGLQEAAKVAVFAELDWSPGVHAQFIGRLARDGQGDENVLAYYVVTDDGSDPTLLDTLGVKLRQSEPLTDPDAPIGAIATTDPDRIRKMARAYLAQRRRRR